MDVRMRRLGQLLILVVMCGVGARLIHADELGLSQPRTLIGPATGAAADALASESPTTSPPAPRPLPLAPPRDRSQRELSQPPAMPNTTSAVTTVVGGLAVALGLFFVLAWFLRRTMPQSMTRLPSEAVEQLGRTPLAGKQNLHLLRVGGKLLLVVVTPFGAETLTEITDADEVDRLSALCKQHGAHGPSAEFRAVLRQFEREPAGPGFLGDTHRPDIELAAAGPVRRTRGELHA